VTRTRGLSLAQGRLRALFTSLMLISSPNWLTNGLRSNIPAMTGGLEGSFTARQAVMIGCAQA